MRIEPTSRVKGDIFDIFGEEYAMEILITPANDEVACPWDADVTFDNGKVYLEGDIAPGGSRRGKCEVVIPVDDFSDYYSIEIPEEAASLAVTAGFLVDESGR